MSPSHRAALLAIGLSLGAGPAAPLLPAQATSATLDRIIKAELARQRVPGVAVAVIKNGKVVKAAGYGLANVEHQVPVTPETIFQSGSVGKQFTAALVMSLVEEGTLALSDTITRFFPDAPESWRGITIRHLLTHTSGIPDYTDETLDYRRDYSEEDLVRLAYGLKPEFPPGARWNYSNTGYMLLGFIVRRATGRFYGDLLHDRVFAPLGMTTTRIISEEDIVPHRAAGYRLVDSALKNQEWVAPKLNTTADGSLYFSIRDLISWERGLRTGAVLKPASWAEIWSPVRLNSGRSYPYGFGWEVLDVAGQKVEQHGGSWQGFRSFIVRYLGDDLTIIVLANLDEAEPGHIAELIAARFNPKLAAPEPAPIPDTEPQVTARLRELLAQTAEGRLAPEEFAYMRAGFFPDGAKAYADLLKDLGPAGGTQLLERNELGDDRIYLYEVRYATRTLRVRLGLGPDDRVSVFSIRR